MKPVTTYTEGPKSIKWEFVKIKVEPATIPAIINEPWENTNYMNAVMKVVEMLEYKPNIIDYTPKGERINAILFFGIIHLVMQKSERYWYGTETKMANFLFYLMGYNKSTDQYVKMNLINNNQLKNPYIVNILLPFKTDRTQREKYNEICEICSIDKKITTNNVLNRGINEYLDKKDSENIQLIDDETDIKKRLEIIEKNPAVMHVYHTNVKLKKKSIDFISSYYYVHNYPYVSDFGGIRDQNNDEIMEQPYQNMVCVMRNIDGSDFNVFPSFRKHDYIQSDIFKKFMMDYVDGYKYVVPDNSMTSNDDLKNLYYYKNSLLFLINSNNTGSYADYVKLTVGLTDCYVFV